MAKSTKKRIAVVGDGASILGFRGLGLHIVQVEELSQAPQILEQMIRSEGFAIIYVTQAVARLSSHVLEETRTLVTPAIITIPMGQDVQLNGLKELSASVKRAIGFDILANAEDDLEEEIPEEDVNYY